MAVLLCRSDGKPFPTPPLPELRGLPRIVVDYQPLPDHLSHQGKLISVRTKSHYTCGEEPREKHWKNIHERHQEQLTQCGFHSPVAKPYRDMGTVVMDDSKLILEGLGQSRDVAGRGTPLRRKTKKPEIPQPTSMNHPYRVIFHSKTPSQFPTKLYSLDQKISQGYTQLEHIRWGRDLYRVLKEDREEKEIQKKELAQKNHNAITNQWREAEVDSDFIVMKDGHLIQQNTLSCGQSDSRQYRSSMPKILSDDLHLGSNERSVTTDREDRIIDQWYRRLCVIVWILDAMQLDSPNHATPFSKCWDIDRPKMDEVKGQKIYEDNKVKFVQWHDIHKVVRAQKNMSGLRNKMSSFMAFRKHSLVTTPSGVSREDGSIRTQDSLLPTASSKSVGCCRNPNQQEEEKIRKQKKLTLVQMDNLVSMLDDELNYSKKQSRSIMNALMKETKPKMKKKNGVVKKEWKTPSISLDVSAMQMEFSDSDEGRRMIVHEQLTAMERDREKAILQRFSSLHISGNLKKDLSVMRKGVEIETTEMARRKLLMNYYWYQELLDLLPSEVKDDHYCQQLLENLSEEADHMSKNGPDKMSKKKLMQVLAILRPWELQAPDIQAAIEFLIQRVIYIAKEDYSKWLEQHILVHHFEKRSI